MKQEDAVSTVIGAVLLVGITVTIGATLYFLVPSAEPQEIISTELRLDDRDGQYLEPIGGDVLSANGTTLRVETGDEVTERTLYELGVGEKWNVGERICIVGPGANCLYPPGTQTQRVVVVGGNQVISSVNTAAIGPGTPVQPKPDLQIAYVGVNNQPVEGQSSTFTFRVQNIGQGDASNVLLEYNEDGTTSRISLGNVAAGADQQITRAWLIPSAGSLTIQATLDPDGAVDEDGNTGNNVASHTFTADAAADEVLDVSTQNLHTIRAGDFDDDGDIDLVATHGNNLLFIEKTGGQFVPMAPVQAGFGGYIYHTEVANLFGDGKDEVVVRDGTGAMEVWSASAGANFDDRVTHFKAGISNANQFDLGDIDGDGQLDVGLIVEHKNDPRMRYKLNDGDLFGGWKTIDDKEFAWGQSFVFFDANNDGNLDAASGHFKSGDTESNFMMFYQEPTNKNPDWAGSNAFKENACRYSQQDWDAGDITGDGRDDLLIVCGTGYNDNAILVATDHGDAENWHHWVIETAPLTAGNVQNGKTGVLTAKFVDFDNDGDLDIISGDAGGFFSFYNNQNINFDVTQWSAGKMTIPRSDVELEPGRAFLDMVAFQNDGDAELEIALVAGNGNVYFVDNQLPR